MIDKMIDELIDDVTKYVINLYNNYLHSHYELDNKYWNYLYMDYITILCSIDNKHKINSINKMKETNIIFNEKINMIKNINNNMNNMLNYMYDIKSKLKTQNLKLKI